MLPWWRRVWKNPGSLQSTGGTSVLCLGSTGYVGAAFLLRVLEMLLPPVSLRGLESSVTEVTRSGTGSSPVVGVLKLDQGIKSILATLSSCNWTNAKLAQTDLALQAAVMTSHIGSLCPGLKTSNNVLMLLKTKRFCHYLLCDFMATKLHSFIIIDANVSFSRSKQPKRNRLFATETKT